MNRRESIATVTAAIFLLPLILGRRRRRARGTASRRPLNSKSEFVPSGVVVVGVGVVGVGVVGVVGVVGFGVVGVTLLSPGKI